MRFQRLKTLTREFRKLASEGTEEGRTCNRLRGGRRRSFDSYGSPPHLQPWNPGAADPEPATRIWRAAWQVRALERSTGEL